MNQLPHLDHLAEARIEHAAILAVILLVLSRCFYLMALCLLLDGQQQMVRRTRKRIKRTWKRTARRLGLTLEEHVNGLLTSPGTTPARRTITPPIRTRREAWGVRIDVHTIEGVGLEELQNAADHLANTWKVPIVRAEQDTPGVVRLRALLWDPLTTALDFTTPALTAHTVNSWLVGVDQDGTDAVIRTKDVSGIAVAGLAGYGKTNVLDTRFAQLAPSDSVQFAVIDGKGGPDWDEHAPRCFAFAKDDLDQAHTILSHLHNVLTARQHLIRDHLGVKNLWEHGPTRSWPLVVLIIDEAHTFFYETKGSDPKSKQRDQVSREIVRMVEELVRKGRNVGIQTILATQKATGDAIPTRIRDNCQVAISFAQRTSEAATAILGSDITQHPDAHPRNLQNPAYVGVATLVADGRPGYTLVRTPRAESSDDIQRLARQNAHLVADPLLLLGSTEPDTNDILILGKTDQ